MTTKKKPAASWIETIIIMTFGFLLGFLICQKTTRGPTVVQTQDYIGHWVEYASADGVTCWQYKTKGNDEVYLKSTDEVFAHTTLDGWNVSINNSVSSHGKTFYQALSKARRVADKLEEVDGINAE
jgi:hypothetical protein